MSQRRKSDDEGPRIHRTEEKDEFDKYPDKLYDLLEDEDDDEWDILGDLFYDDDEDLDNEY